MNTQTALRLLGALASETVQRRYIVHGTKDAYLLPQEIVNDGAYFLRYPGLGETQLLPSVQEFARVFKECAPKVPLNDATVSNEMLVELDPYWARIRSSAKTVLQEMGADLESWERGEIDAGVEMIDRSPYSAEMTDPRKILASLHAVRSRPSPKDPTLIGCFAALGAGLALLLLRLVAQWTTLSSSTLGGITIILGVIVIVGGLFRVFGGGFVSGGVAADVEEAIDQLVAAFPDGDPAILRQAAVRILNQSAVSSGPTTVGTFDRNEVAKRLGNALPYVLLVERILLKRDKIYPCFTVLDSVSGAATRDKLPAEI